jgi:hypothetical protein
MEVLILVAFVAFSILYFLSFRSVSMLQKQNHPQKDRIMLRAYKNGYHVIVFFFITVTTLKVLFNYKINYHLVFTVAFISMMFITNLTILALMNRKKNLNSTNY